MQDTSFQQELLHFINQSPTPFHVTKNAAVFLKERGFSCLDGHDISAAAKPGKYFFTHNDSSLIAVNLQQELAGTANSQISPFHMAGSHTDSPGLKVKPHPLLEKQGCIQVGVEVYGGPLLNTWFDRDLSLAGRVTFLHPEQGFQSCLIDFNAPIAILPNLAIHLDREANTKKSINKQTDLVPIIGTRGERAEEEAPHTFADLLKASFAQELPADAEILDYDLFFYDVQPGIFLGLEKDLMTGGRLDNQLSCYTLLHSLSQAGTEENKAQTNGLIVLNDHEEVGSVSTAGAEGTFLSSVCSRLIPDADRRARIMEQSLFISVDNAHAVHPNFVSKYEPQHLPQLNQGPVIKMNANQRYASNAVTAGLFRLLCKNAGVPVQSFVMRNDMPCGSTIGPATAARLGIPTVDVGVPTFAMHSIRETAGTQDCAYLKQVMEYFFTTPLPPLSHYSA